MTRTSCIRRDDDSNVHFVLQQQFMLDFYSASSLKQQSAGRHVARLGHIILIPSQAFCSYSLILHIQNRSSKNQFHIIWFDPTGVPALDLLHLKREW